MAPMRKALKRLALLLLLLAIVAGGTLAAAPAVGRWYVLDKLLPRLGQRLGRRLTVGAVMVGFQKVTLEQLEVRSGHDPAGSPMLSIPRVTVEYDPWSLAGDVVQVSTVVLHRPSIQLLRAVTGESNFVDLLNRRGSSGSVSGGGKVQIQQIHIRAGRLALQDLRGQVELRAQTVEGSLRPGGESTLRLLAVDIRSPRLPSLISFAKITASGSRGKPRVKLQGGQLRLLSGLDLTGIGGSLQPMPGDKVSIRLVGSYGGARTRLWEARGWVGTALDRGSMKIRAARLGLARIRSILGRTPVILPHATMLDGRLDLALEQGVVSAAGSFSVSRLNLFHPALARTPVLGLSGRATLKGRLDLRRSRIQLQQLSVVSRDVEVQLSGTYDGSKAKPVLELAFKVPPVPCNTVLRAFPPSLVPNLKDFSTRGTFSVDLRSRIDFADLETLTLKGKVGINRCKVVKAPSWADAKRLTDQFDHQVEVKPGRYMAFIVGPDGEHFTPYDEISPAVVHALLTTEDGGFFRHHGFITSQFRKALARNLKRGGFRLGASTITMQMVKNVLLTSEKTLSRKLQEMFITWYLEQKLTKERILEIYLNIIELGPGIYGIGAASQHYFGKVPRDLTPLEAAFVATLLPNPRGRYVQYCHGKPTPKWDRYVRRVLKRMAQKGYVSDVAMDAAANQQLAFVRDLEALSEADCKRMVKDLVEQWREERRLRLRSAILQSAPHQLELHIKN